MFIKRTIFFLPFFFFFLKGVFFICFHFLPSQAPLSHPSFPFPLINRSTLLPMTYYQEIQNSQNVEQSAGWHHFRNYTKSRSFFSCWLIKEEKHSWRICGSVKATVQCITWKTREKSTSIFLSLKACVIASKKTPKAFPPQKKPLSWKKITKDINVSPETPFILQTHATNKSANQFPSTRPVQPSWQTLLQSWKGEDQAVSGGVDITVMESA